MLPAVVANPQIRGGALRPLGVTTQGGARAPPAGQRPAERALGAAAGAEPRHGPGVKSSAQQGFAGFEAPTWWAMLGRAGTPEPILRRMSEAMTATLAAPEVRGRIEEQGADVVASGPEQCRRFLN